MNYKKPPLNINKQIQLLKKRGLLVDDEEKLENYLRNISYYHLSAYFKFFQHKEKETFKEKVFFKDVLNIYIFDQKLRLLLLDLLERIEKSFKCRMAYEIAIARNNSHWILDKNLFLNNRYEQFIVPSLKEIKKSKELCARHYYNKYKNPVHPPVWIMIEILSFGSCVTIYRQLRRNEQKLIARSYGLEDIFVVNWMHALSKIRNICAHHSRLWNSNVNMKLKQFHNEYGNFFANKHSRKNSYTPLFDYLVILQIMLCKIYPRSTWDDKLLTLINEHKIEISHMGFPEDWKKRLEKIRKLEIVK